MTKFDLTGRKALVTGGARGLGEGMAQALAAAGASVMRTCLLEGGTLTLTVDPQQVTLCSKDVGPGIPDIDKAMTEGYSTANEEARSLGFGAGMGLPNMKRNASTFEIQSQAGVGTSITMGFRLDGK